MTTIPTDPYEQLEQIEESDCYLTDWERKFIKNISKQLEDDHPLTDNQQAKLDQIYEERFLRQGSDDRADVYSGHDRDQW